VTGHRADGREEKHEDEKSAQTEQGPSQLSGATPECSSAYSRNRSNERRCQHRKGENHYDNPRELKMGSSASDCSLSKTGPILHFLSSHWCVFIVVNPTAHVAEMVAVLCRRGCHEPSGLLSGLRVRLIMDALAAQTGMLADARATAARGRL
jgi:hypothetical protein